MSESKVKYSVIVPVYNEQGNVGPLHKEIIEAMQSLNQSYEIIFVDDGSTDNTYKNLVNLSGAKIIRLRGNSGQSAALDVGIKHARGDIIITLDGDGQNDPADILKLLERLEGGYDVVCGWRKKRADSPKIRFISWGARLLRGILVDDGVHDAGCTLRVYKREVFEGLDLYGELHRMIPALLKWRGFKITELIVRHRPRRIGITKYTSVRILRGLLDMMYVWFWRKYSTKPMHLFGGVGVLFSFIGGLILLLMAYLRLFHAYFLSDKIWPLVGFFFIIVGIQLVATGLLAAQLVEKQGGQHYSIVEIRKIRRQANSF
ncbi:MAG: glycosyltransferase family 2 protein [Candidatus Paceibacterota bacterium]